MKSLREELKIIGKNTMGVYKIFDKDFKLIYVGKSYNLKQRLSSSSREHITGEFISYMILGDERAVDLIEINIIDKYKPEFNVILTQYPSAFKGYKEYRFEENFTSPALIDIPQVKSFAFCSFVKNSKSRKITKLYFIDSHFISDSDENNIPKYLKDIDVNIVRIEL